MRPWSVDVWRAAVQLELDTQAHVIWAPVGAVRESRAGWCVTYRRERLRKGQDSGRNVRVDDGLAGAPIAFAGRGGASVWSGSVALVDPTSAELVVSLEQGRPPRPGDTFRVHPPGWLVYLHRWLQSASLPPDVEEVVRSRCSGGHPQATHGAVLTGLRARQRDALGLVAAPLGVLWGPPGTGKTHTLARMVADAVSGGKRVLVLGPTHVAADGACLAVDACFEAVGLRRDEGRILRTALPRLYEAFEARGVHLLAWTRAEHAYGAEVARLRREEARLTSALATAATLAVTDGLRLELLAVGEGLAAARANWEQRQAALIDGASVVCATTRQALNRGFAASFDLVLVDEASMVSRSDGLAVICQSDGPVVFAGDHKQLGPIREARGADASEEQGLRFWLEDSILDALVPYRGRGVPWVMLDEQGRMNRELCEIVSRLSYENALTSVDPPAAGIPPRLRSGVCVLDTDLPDVRALPRFLEDHDRDLGRPFDWRLAMPSTARKAVALARWLYAQGHSVALSTPFAAQAAMLSRGVADIRGDRMVAGTVHRIQGQEATVSIFDPARANHPFISSGPVAARLVNVAASRARRAFVLCNGRRYLEGNTHLRPFVEVATPIDIE